MTGFAPPARIPIPIPSWRSLRFLKNRLRGKKRQSPTPDWDPQNWYSEDATAEVWSGDQPELGEMIAASLQENQIHSRPSNSAGNCALFVLPGDEARACEIVREIVDAAPPE
jgi:hypothetical protein